MALLSLLDIHFSTPFSARPILSHIHASVSPGERVALIGPTGSGKSLLFKIAMGLVSPTSGEVHFHGKPLNKLSDSELLEFHRSVGMTLQKGGLIDSLTCEGNLKLPLWELERVGGKEASLRVESVLDSVGLLPALHFRIGELSGGMRKRLAIARAVLFSPQLILYDEPTEGLDPVTSHQIVEVLLEHQSKNQMAMVVISNDPAVLRECTEKILFLRDAVVEGPTAWSEVQSVSAACHQFIHGDLEGPLTANL